jgi:hypothetical protein
MTDRQGKEAFGYMHNAQPKGPGSVNEIPKGNQLRTRKIHQQEFMMECKLVNVIHEEDEEQQ